MCMCVYHIIQHIHKCPPPPHHRQDVREFVDVGGDELDVGHGGDAREVVDHADLVAVLCGVYVCVCMYVCVGLDVVVCVCVSVGGMVVVVCVSVGGVVV
jgi:hypothetical protein